MSGINRILSTILIIETGPTKNAIKLKLQPPRENEIISPDEIAEYLFQTLVDQSIGHVLHISAVKASQPFVHNIPPHSLVPPSPPPTYASPPPTPPSPTLSPRMPSSPTSSPRLTPKQSPPPSPQLSASSHSPLPNIFARPNLANNIAVIDRNTDQYVDELFQFIELPRPTPTSTGTLATPFPVDVFIQLEKSRPKPVSEDQQIYNKLVFDSVNEAVVSSRVPSSPASAMQKVAKWARVGQKGDDVVALIMQEQHDRSLWMNWEEERLAVISEVVSSLFNDLLEDTVQALHMLEM